MKPQQDASGELFHYADEVLMEWINPEENLSKRQQVIIAFFRYNPLIYIVLLVITPNNILGDSRWKQDNIPLNLKYLIVLLLLQTICIFFTLFNSWY